MANQFVGERAEEVGFFIEQVQSKLNDGRGRLFCDLAGDVAANLASRCGVGRLEEVQSSADLFGAEGDFGWRGHFGRHLSADASIVYLLDRTLEGGGHYEWKWKRRNLEWQRALPR